MSNRKPSLATQLRNAREELKQAQAELAKLRDQHTAAQRQSDGNARLALERSDEIEQIHAMLDAMPGSIERKVPNATQGWGDVHRNTVTRLGAWFASAAARGAA